MSPTKTTHIEMCHSYELNDPTATVPRLHRITPITKECRLHQEITVGPMQFLAATCAEYDEPVPLEAPHMGTGVQVGDLAGWPAPSVPTAEPRSPIPSCVYHMCMARVNVYLPDDLADAAREAQLNVSSVTQEALRSALAARRGSAWLARMRRLPSLGVGHDQVIEALDAVRAEEDDVGPFSGP